MGFTGKCLAGLSLVAVLTACGSSGPANDEVRIEPAAVRRHTSGDPLSLRTSAERAAVYQWRVAVWGRAFDEYRASIYAAVLEQARYDREQRERVARAVAEANEPEPEPVYVASEGTGRCGGDLPPCYVMECESGGDIHAENPSSSASGKWQFLDGTWQSVTGLPGSASDYPEDVQDDAARQLYAQSGTSPWECA